MFGLPVLLFWEAPPNDQVIFVFSSTFTNPTLLHVKPVNAAASRASSSRLNLIIGHTVKTGPVYVIRRVQASSASLTNLAPHSHREL